LNHKKTIVVLSGAGVSAESGISTFRDSNGLWENHAIEDVATPQGWRKNPKLVLDFYNQRRRQLKDVSPNVAHFALAKLQEKYNVFIITQNVDDLHERAGSNKVIHLHGELRKVRSTLNPSLVYEWTEDVNLGDKCARGSQLRPHIVWFGEAVPMMETASDIVTNADVLIIVGTSLQVYPAAGLMYVARPNIPIYYVDPHPATDNLPKNVKVLKMNATEGIPKVIEMLT
jgi:NAD-dependent deacetylase